MFERHCTDCIACAASSLKDPGEQALRDAASKPQQPQPQPQIQREPQTDTSAFDDDSESYGIGEDL
jgi:hypothetical protein